MKLGLFILIAIWLVSACGGDSDSTTPESDVSAPLPPPPTNVSLQVSGTLSSANMANAILTASVGSSRFETSADEQGNYTFDIEVNEGEQNNILILDAVGIGSNQQIHYKTYVDSIENLLAIGSSINDSDQPSLKISSLHTVLSALISYENEISDAESLSRARQKYDRALIAPLSVMLGYFTGTVNGQVAELPEGVETTWDLVSNRELAISTSLALGVANTTEFEESILSLVTNPEAPSLPALDALITNYYFVGLDNYDGNGKLELFEDGTGLLTLSAFEYSVIWDLQSNALNLALEGPSSLNYIGGFLCDAFATNASVGFLNESKESMVLGAVFTYERICADNPSLNEISTSFRQFEVVKEQNLLEPTWLTAGEYTLQTPNVWINRLSTELQGAVRNFSNLTTLSVRDGNSFTLRRAIDFSIDNEVIYKEYQGIYSVDQKLLTFSLEDEETLEFNIAKLLDEGLAVLSLSGTEISVSNDTSMPSADVDVESKQRVQKSALILKNTATSFAQSGIVGWYESSYISWPSKKAVWYEYKPNGSVITYTWVDINDDGKIQATPDANNNPSEITTYTRYWRINEEGDVEHKLFFPIYRGNEAACVNASFDSFPESDCYIRESRKISLLNTIENQVHYSNNYQRYIFNGITTQTELNALSLESFIKLDSKPTLLQEAGL
ncbi:hypothetical protein ISG33_02675 [Glaciecola sp. MH2013]|uniref:hypothetical protein n=1 Tax=Glaciecola sp. MH2013 TaxID=2785524 RepID=UPI00189EE8EA|nr:hypothetical protein [Glaciecola sp. MH2013]MBF7072307.1 hypothetical protein [Glaciecola sp. MH2013]